MKLNWLHYVLIVIITLLLVRICYLELRLASDQHGVVAKTLFLTKSNFSSPSHLPTSSSVKMESMNIDFINGVAVTLFMGAPKWFQNRYSMMVNQVLASLPTGWKVQIFYLSTKRMALEAINYPGIQKQVRKGNVILTPLPDSMAKFKRNQVFLSPWFWRNIVADNVLLFGGNSVLCANSPTGLDAFIGKFDYLGAPWKSLGGQGGDGGISLRNRIAVEAALSATINSSATPALKKEDTAILSLIIDRNGSIADVKVCITNQ